MEMYLVYLFFVIFGLALLASIKLINVLMDKIEGVSNSNNYDSGINSSTENTSNNILYDDDSFMDSENMFQDIHGHVLDDGEPFKRLR